MPAPSLQPLRPQRPWAQGPGVRDDAREAGGAGSVKGSTDDVGAGPLLGDRCSLRVSVRAPQAVPTGHMGLCLRGGPRPQFLTPFASISREPDNALCTPRGPAPPGMPSLLPTEPDRDSSPGSLPLRRALLGHLVLQQACLSGGHWSLKETENISPKRKDIRLQLGGLSRFTISEVSRSRKGGPVSLHSCEVPVALRFRGR